jgi:hypothetical protein
MASTTQDKLYQTFVAVSGQPDSNTVAALDSGEEIAASLSNAVNPIGQQQANASTAQPASGSGGGSTAEAIVSTVLASGMGMVPLVLGLLELFGSGGTPAPPTFEKYAMPERQYFQGADTGSDASDADYDQMGMPRAYRSAPAGTSAETSGSASPGGTSSGSAASGAAAPQITVNVQAMDSQSFLDHSNEIAQAVRAAMLNSNSINDVVNNL